MLLKISSVLLVIWGLTNAIGGLVGGQTHPAPWIGPLFFAVGLLITLGGVGLWRRRAWGLAISLTGVLALSGVALLSSVLLRGAGGMRLSHHVLRLLVSASLLLAAWVGSRRADRGGRHVPTVS